ncbi:right-handed parallel beta-helix repeat-containing protein [Agrilutibacter solisilvae]|uniref:Right-handed parallel beta-helix repeat-containing protein n=1 Tax=Agrilutibacter solisilvae TaxID=2763317 RepID=A0A974Y0L0_9GAMM|nr:right-handed parallel beta-helix repeat-containing protein [Lysobacter solisilvae]QSX79221.1 right-handed parallel beta-helix repeat-containing protein [Lysobacter solisilvae]
MGISAGASRHNAIVRNCRVQGFKRGVVLFGGGHVVEDNHLDLNTYNGIYVTGDSIARGNVVTDTGGRPNEVYADGIIAIGPGVQVIDNAIRGVSPAGNVGGDRAGRGIYLNAGLAQGNRIFGIVASGSHGAAGIQLLGKTIARDNLVQAPSGTAGAGISGAGTDLSLCQDNTVQGFLSGIGTCQLAGANGVQ